MNILLRFCIFAVLASMILSAQEPEPLSFFPHHVGDMWMYRYDNHTNRSTVITGIETDTTGNTAIYYDTVQEPAYIINSNYDVYFYPETLTFLEFKLTAQAGDTWRVTTYSNSSLVARVQQRYQTLVFGQPTTLMAINYYEVVGSDTIITENSPYRYTHFLASGFGFIRQLGESGDVPIDLIGCIINGKTFGTVTDVEASPISSTAMTVSPNPCSSFTTITVPSGTQNIHLAVYNTLGILVWQDRIQESAYTLNTTLLPAGVYFCKATAGSFTAIHKIIIQR